MITEEELQRIESTELRGHATFDRLIAEVRRLNNELDLAARGVITHAVVRSARRAERERCAKVADMESAASKRNAQERATAFRIADAIRALPEEG